MLACRMLRAFNVSLILHLISSVLFSQTLMALLFFWFRKVAHKTAHTPSPLPDGFASSHKLYFFVHAGSKVNLISSLYFSLFVAPS